MVEANPLVTATSLCLVHGGVGEAQELLYGVAIFTDGDANAGGRSYPVTAEMDWFTQQTQQPFCDDGRSTRINGPSQQDREFVATEPTYGVARAKRKPDAISI
jgi:hypothetical protein